MKGDRTWFVLYDDGTDGGRKFGQISVLGFFRTERGAKQAAYLRKVRHPFIRKEILVGSGKWRLPRGER